MEKLYYIFLYFVFYSVIGYICEVFYVYLGDKKWVNRGFMHGPYIPIYGNGAMLVSFAITSMHIKKDSFIIFLFGVVLCSLLEYTTSYVMEKVFHNRWWDYSERKYNLNGRVCLQNSVLFGVGSVAIIYLFNPLFNKLYHVMCTTTLMWVSIIIFITMLTDFLISFFEALKVSSVASHLDKLIEEYEKKKTLGKKIKTRLIEAYPYLVKRNTKLLDKLKKLKNKDKN